MENEKSKVAGGHVWPRRFSRWSIRFAVSALAVAAIGLTMARYDVIPKLAGFSSLLGGGLLALLAVFLGLAGLITGRGHTATRRGRVLAAIAFSLCYVGFLGSRPLAASKAPAIHDITTNLTNPPQFDVLALRKDNLVGVGNTDNWRRIHAAAYGDLMPVMILRPIPVVTADAVRLAKESGWQIVSSDLARGHIEATASVSYIRFHDDVVIRITPMDANRASLVDMRSVSRVGIGDLGVNANRIRKFLAQLAS